MKFTSKKKKELHLHSCAKAFPSCSQLQPTAASHVVGVARRMQEERQLPANGDRVLHPGRLPAGARPAGEARRAHRRPGAAVVAPLQVQARPGARRRARRLRLRRRARVGPPGRALRLHPFRPAGAPAAVVALQNTLLRAPTFRRDVTDDLRFLAWDSLKGSVRFAARSPRCAPPQAGSAPGACASAATRWAPGSRCRWGRRSPRRASSWSATSSTRRPCRWP